MWRPEIRREQRWLWRAFACLVVLVALGAGWVALAREGAVRYTGVAKVQLPLPAALERRGAAESGLPAPELRSEPTPERAGLDPALIEYGPFGPLPRIGPDGRRPFLAYARPFNFDDARPEVAILLLGVGLQSDLLEAALALPGPISLQFSPYAPDLPALVERARRAGHEALLDLPMEPSDYPASDPGPHTLLADGPRDENVKRLNWLLARTPGYIAFAGAGTRFARSDQVALVLDVLARRGLALVELGTNHLAPAAAAAGLPYASTPPAIDEDPSVLSIDYALAGLEAEALAGGSALGVAQGYPVTLERLRLWVATLEGKGLVLAPVSAVLIEQAGLAREADTDGQRATARSEG
jgi:uncharacterized protein